MYIVLYVYFSLSSALVFYLHDRSIYISRKSKLKHTKNSENLVIDRPHERDGQTFVCRLSFRGISSRERFFLLFAFDWRVVKSSCFDLPVASKPMIADVILLASTISFSYSMLLCFQIRKEHRNIAKQCVHEARNVRWCKTRLISREIRKQKWVDVHVGDGIRCCYFSTLKWIRPSMIVSLRTTWERFSLSDLKCFSRFRTMFAHSNRRIIQQRLEEVVSSIEADLRCTSDVVRATDQ